MSTPRATYEAALERYLPEGCAARVTDWLLAEGATLRISKARTTKLGDYRAPIGGQGHRISVNHNLNPYGFLITLVHEIAHMQTWIRHRNMVKPHGKEWKSVFRFLMEPFLASGTFPADVATALDHYMRNPGASSCSDEQLYRALKRYDPQNGTLLLEEVPDQGLFSLNQSRVFQKGEKLRKRYRCLEVTTQRHYLINALAEVRLVEK